MLKKRLEGHTQANDLLPIKNGLKGNPGIAVGRVWTTVTQGHDDLGSMRAKHVSSWKHLL